VADATAVIDELQVSLGWLGEGGGTTTMVAAEGVPGLFPKACWMCGRRGGGDR
jgi:hypothetical protein